MAASLRWSFGFLYPSPLLLVVIPQLPASFLEHVNSVERRKANHDHSHLSDLFYKAFLEHLECWEHCCPSSYPGQRTGYFSSCAFSCHGFTRLPGLGSTPYDTSVSPHVARFFLPHRTPSLLTVNTQPALTSSLLYHLLPSK